MWIRKPSRLRRKRTTFPWKIVTAVLLVGFMAGHFLNEALHTPEGVPYSSMQSSAVQPVDVEQKPSLAGSYLVARQAMINYDDGAAAEAYAEALRVRPNDQDLLRQAFEAYLIAGEVDKAIALLQRAEDAGDGLGAEARDILYMPMIRLVGLVDNVKRNNTKQALVQVDEYLQSGRLTRFHTSFFMLFKAWLMVEEGDASEMRQALAPVLNTDGLAPFANFHAGMMHASLGKKADATKAYTTSLEQVSTMPHRVVELYANFLQVWNEKEAKDGLLAQFWEENQDVWMEPYEMEAILARHDNTLMVRNVKDGIAELLYGSASILQQQGDSATAYRMLHLALYVKPDLEVARMLLADFLEREKRYEEAIAQYDAISKDSPIYRRARMEIAHAMSRNGEQQRAISMLRKSAINVPESVTPWLHLGDIYRNEEEFSRAADAYSEALERMDKDKQHLWPIYYMRGICYERSDQWQSAEGDFEKALDLSPSNADVLNYLGYSWLVMGKNIDQAFDMISKAVNARPHDAHIIDSMGWALYHLGRYDEAQAYLERSIELMPNDATVNDHLGDVYWKLGRKREARFQWERALLFDPDEKLEASLKTKLESGMPDHSSTVQAKQE